MNASTAPLAFAVLIVPLLLAFFVGQAPPPDESSPETAATSLLLYPPQELSLFDYDAGAWELVDQRMATPHDSVVTLVIESNPERFLEPGTNALKMRLDWFDPGNVFSPRWGVRIDRAIWMVEP